MSEFVQEVSGRLSWPSVSFSADAKHFLYRTPYRRSAKSQ